MGQSKTRISHTSALVAETATRGRSAHPAQGPDVALSWADALSGWNHSVLCQKPLVSLSVWNQNFGVSFYHPQNEQEGV